MFGILIISFFFDSFMFYFLTASNLMCIEKLYGDSGLDAIDLMEECGRMALPIFLGRLKKKKQGGLIQLKEDFNEKNK